MLWPRPCRGRANGGHGHKAQWVVVIHRVAGAADRSSPGPASSYSHSCQGTRLPSSRRRKCNFLWLQEPGSQPSGSKLQGSITGGCRQSKLILGGDQGCVQSLAGAGEVSGSGHGEGTCLDGARVSFIREEGRRWGD